MFFKLNNACDGRHCSVDVRVTKTCQNNCAFCIEKTGLASQGKTDADAIIRSIRQAKHDAGKPLDVLLLGGEPFLELDALCKICEELVGEVGLFITTSLPPSIFEKRENWKKIRFIMSLIDGINVSVLSPWSYKNNQLFGGGTRADRFVYLRELADEFPDKVRVNANLMKGGIEFAGDVLVTLKVLASLGVQEVKFNELQNCPDKYVSFSRLFPGCRLKEAYAFGCQSDVSRHFNRDPYADFIGQKMRVKIKRSCFLVEPSQSAGVCDMIKALYKRWFHKPTGFFRVVYENGMAANGWLQKEKCR